MGTPVKVKFVGLWIMNQMWLHNQGWTIKREGDTLKAHVNTHGAWDMKKRGYITQELLHFVLLQLLNV